MQKPIHQIYSFDEFTLDLTRGCLLRQTEEIKLRPKSFEVLKYLIKNGGRLISKDEIIEIVWQGMAVTDDSLVQCLKDIRRALDDKSQNFIKTVPGRGYIFEKEVSENGGTIYTEETSGVHLVIEETLENRREEISRQSAVGKKVDYLIGAVKRHKSAMFALLTALIIASLGISYVGYNFMKNLPMNFQAQKSTRLTAVGKAVSATISPDGKYMVYVVEDGKQQSLWLRHIASESTVQLLPPGKNVFSGLQFSPDSNRVYFNAGKSVYQIPVLGGTPAKVLDDVHGGLTFSPDAKQIAFRRIQGENREINSIIIADADGKNQRQLISREDIFDSPIAWSPDGKVIACLRIDRAELHTKEILAVQVADGTAAPIPSLLWLNIGQIAWMSDGKSLVIVAEIMEGDESGISQIWQVQYPGGEARNVTNDSNYYTNVSLTADGNSLVSVKLEQVAHIWMMPADDINLLRQLTFGSDKYDGTYGISWLPDGRIVYDSAPNRKPEAWIVEADGNNSKQLTPNAGTTAVSPDGRWLVYQYPAKEKMGLWRMEISDSSKKQITQKPDLWATFSPDSKWVIYQGFSDQIPPASLYKVSIDGGESIQLTKNIVPFSPTVSPDGKQIAFSFGRMEENQYRQKIALIPFNGGEITKTFDANLQQTYGNLQWTSDGKAIYYIAVNNGVSNIWRQAIDGSAPVQVTNFTSNHIFNFAYSSDGVSLALSRGTFNSDVVLIENLK